MPQKCSEEINFCELLFFFQIHKSKVLANIPHISKDIEGLVIVTKSHYENLTMQYTGGSNEYPQSLFWSKNKKNRYTLHTPDLLYNSGVEEGIYNTDMFS